MAVAATPSSPAVANLRLALVLSAATGLAVAALVGCATSIAAQGGYCSRQLLDCDHGPAALNAAKARIALAPPGAAPVSATSLETARGAAVAAPAAADPLVYAAMIAVVRNDDAQARSLFTEALRRNPRSAEARSYFFDKALRQSRFAEAIQHGDRLTYLLPQVTPAVTAVFAAMAQDSRAVPALSAVLDKAPLWRGEFFNQLRKRGGDPSLVFRLLDGRKTSDDVVVENEQDALVMKLAQAGDYDRAYLAWTNFLPASALASVDFVYDSEFNGSPGARPFNWQLLGGAEAAVAMENGALSVDYYGRVAMRLAQQTILLPPGSYRLSVIGQTISVEPKGELQWRIFCQPANQPIGELKLGSLSAREQRYSAAFAVPASCAAAQIVLEASPPDNFTGGLEARFKSAKIDRVR